jgi:dTDP-4-amino-4,6-dideoxygalactose transaminase
MLFNYEPQITEDDIEAVSQCMREGIAVPSHIEKCEKLFEEQFDLNALLCSSGTSALHVALLMAGIKKGDEVICPSLTFAASWNVIEYCGAIPVFVDIDPFSWCMSIEDVQKKISKKTKAILAVDLFGVPCNYEELKIISEKNNITLIQDGAESLGSLYEARSVLAQGDISISSFNLNKIITSCGGGALICRDKKMIASAKKLINQNKKGSSYDYYGPGYNYRMGAINAALLSSQIKRFPAVLKRKRLIHTAYINSLSSLDLKFQIPHPRSWVNGWIMAVKFSSKKQRNKVHENLFKNEIESKTIFKPACNVKWLKEKYNLKSTKNAKNLYETALILPSSASLSNKEIERVCDVVRGSFDV